jgi:hypothetical protein
MDINSIPTPSLREIFKLECKVKPPVVVGQDEKNGRRQLIIVNNGIVSGEFNGKLMPGGVDAQIIRSDGFTDLSARYAIELDDGRTMYIENNGMRRVDPKVAHLVAQGQIVDPKYVYFAAVPKFEVYDESLRWLERSLIISYAVRLPDMVLLRFYEVV